MKFKITLKSNILLEFLIQVQTELSYEFTFSLPPRDRKIFEFYVNYNIVIILWSLIYHEDLEKRGGFDVVARERHESHMSQ